MTPKPLSELINHKDDCSKIFAFFFPLHKFETHTKVGRNGARTTITKKILGVAASCQIDIEDTGPMYPMIASVRIGFNVFAVCDFFRKLGYDVI